MLVARDVTRPPGWFPRVRAGNIAKVARARPNACARADHLNTTRLHRRAHQAGRDALRRGFVSHAGRDACHWLSRPFSQRRLHCVLGIAAAAATASAARSSCLRPARAVRQASASAARPRAPSAPAALLARRSAR
eukprot:1053532-Pleurochrysis_carterae.AAC.5